MRNWAIFIPSSFSQVWALKMRDQNKCQKLMKMETYCLYNQLEIWFWWSTWCKSIYFPKLRVVIMLKMPKNGLQNILNSPKQSKTQNDPKISNGLVISFEKSTILGMLCTFFSDFCSQNPHFWAKNPKKCIFEEIAKISVHNCSKLKIFAYLICQKYDFYHLNDVKLYIVQTW